MLVERNIYIAVCVAFLKYSNLEVRVLSVSHGHSMSTFLIPLML